MDGLMMDRPLLVKQIAERAEAVFGRPRGRRADPGGRRALHLRAGRRAGPAPGQRARRARRGARRSSRELRLELAPPPRALPRGAEHGRRAAHAQHPAVRGGPPLHRRARGRPRDLPRRLAGGGDAAVRGRRARGPDAGRPRRAPGSARLRGAGGERRPGVRVPRARREHGGGHVLHERHHRPAEGGAVLAPLDRPPHPRRGAARLDGHSRGRLGDAGGADVPRDGLGHPVHRHDAGGDGRSCPAPT